VAFGRSSILAALPNDPIFSLRALFRSWHTELASFPNRWSRAARVGFVTAVCAAAMGVLQIANPLGLTLVLSFAAPESAFSIGTAVSFLIGTAALQLVTLAIVGALASSPVTHVGVFIAYTFVSTYLIYGVPHLGRLWIWAQIPTVTSFYLVLFDYRGLGWENAQMFAGMVVAVTMVWLLGVIWPEPAPAVLEESLRNTLERSRRRLLLLVAIFLGDDNAVPAQDHPVASKLGYHLTLLKPATQNAKSLRESAGLLATVMVAERIHNEIDRLSVPACTQLGATLDDPLRRDLRDAANVLDAALEDHIVRRGDRVTAELQPLLAKLLSAPAATAQSLALTAIAAHLENIASLLATAGDDLPDELAIPVIRPTSTPALHSSKFLVRFSARHTLGMTLAFVSGLFDNSAAIHAALWLLMIGGPPSHGATAKKFTVRAIGAAGALVFTAVATAVLLLNFVTLPPYMLAIFVGVTLITYVGEGGGQLSYLAIGGTAFVIAFSGPGPRRDIIGSIWTIWGISFGMILRALISVIWREHANRTLAEQFERPLAALVALVPDHQVRSTNEIAASEMVVFAGIQEMLTIATDAQLQGRTAGIDASRLVDALDTTRRLAFALGNLRLDRQNELDSRLHAQIESWLANLRYQLEPGQLDIAPLRTMVARAAVIDLETDPFNDPARTRVAMLVRTLAGQLGSISVH
jgi:hypothetical protein